MKLNSRIAAIGCIASALAPIAIVAQQPVPLRTLSPPEATSESFASIVSVRALNGGGVLVNDSVKRQLVALDTSLRSPRVKLDSSSSGMMRYDSRSLSLIPYRGDSLLVRSIDAHKFFVIDPNGDVSRPFDQRVDNGDRMFTMTPAGFDGNGNALIAGMPLFRLPVREQMQRTTSAWIQRVNFNAQKFEDVAEVKMEMIGGSKPGRRSDGTMYTIEIVNPLPTQDEWTVLSDGSVVVVHTDDYRVEIVKPDGKKRISGKIPFVKRRLSDEDKRRLIDSARTAIEARKNGGSANPLVAIADEMMRMGKDSIKALSNAGTGAFRMSINTDAPRSTELEFFPLRDIDNYLQPFRPGGVKSDRDGNVWIATSAVSPDNSDETIYDIVNNEAKLVQRVRVPATHTLVGFARGGIVYVKVKRGENEWVLERMHVVD